MLYPSAELVRKKKQFQSAEKICLGFHFSLSESAVMDIGRRTNDSTEKNLIWSAPSICSI